MAIILIVCDDDDFVQELMLDIRDAGHEPRIAENTRRALERLIYQAPGIILYGYDMPDSDGYDFLRTIKTDAEYSNYKDIPVIGIGNIPPTDRRHLDKFLTRPINIMLLKRCIDDCLNVA